MPESRCAGPIAPPGARIAARGRLPLIASLASLAGVVVILSRSAARRKRLTTLWPKLITIILNSSRNGPCCGRPTSRFRKLCHSGGPRSPLPARSA